MRRDRVNLENKTASPLYHSRRLLKNVLKKNHIIKKFTGFTLIELLIVVSVIGVLSGGVIALMNPTTQYEKANDSKRKSDLKQIQSALDAYYNDWGKYPEPEAAAKLNLESKYIAVLPDDPKSTKKYAYVLSDDKQSYCLYASLEQEKSTLSKPVPTGSCGTADCNYAVSSPNTNTGTCQTLIAQAPPTATITPTPRPTSTPRPTYTPMPTSTPTPTPMPCVLEVAPSSQYVVAGNTGAITASVTSGLGTAKITKINFASSNTTAATVDPASTTSSPYSTTANALDVGTTLVTATATLSDKRTCQATGTVVVTPSICVLEVAPSSQYVVVGSTGAITADVTSGLGTAKITKINFASSNTTAATVNPASATSSPYSTTANAVSVGTAVVTATATLSDNRTCQATGTVDIRPPNAVPLACGMDIALVLDTSGSISNGNLRFMKDTFNTFVNALLPATPTQFSVTDFSTTASVLQNFSGNATTIKAAIDNAGKRSSTNWQDGLLKGKSTFGSALNRQGYADLMIFASDGRPNTYYNNRNGLIQTVDSDPAALNPAIEEANTIKNTGIRILAIGIGFDSGSDIEKANNIAKLKTISGERLNGASFEETDLITTDYAALPGKLRNFVNEVCGRTISVTSLIDADGKLDTINDREGVNGWKYNIGGVEKITKGNGDEKGKTDAVQLAVRSGYEVKQENKNGYTLLSAYCTGLTNSSSIQLDLLNKKLTGINVAPGTIGTCTFISKRN